ncbi:MAG TPA: ATP-dependent helicase [Verrucomicrobiae bacterium]|jgi:DNA helicase-2/ATP-dependent DNA helicase PcrA
MSREYVLQPFRSTSPSRIDFAGELNEQQHAVVTAPPGPALVIAGAGSGKTRTLTYRVAFLLEQGIPAESILLLTFTNKAAREMMQRVGELLGGELPGLWGGTFHSIGARILRRYSSALGYERDFSILDREDSKDLIKACLDGMEIDQKSGHFPKADVLSDIFSLATNEDKAVEAVLKEQFDYFLEQSPKITRARDAYQARKKTANAMDFDDLLALWLRLLRENAEAREEQQRRFQFLLVDEYQDTNKIQGALLDLLAARHDNLMVVGDDSQSIYSWRGAHFQNILKFPDRHPKTIVYRIETNYRSTPEILQLANSAIAANTEQFPKQLTAARPSGSKPALVACGDGAMQAAFVAQRIMELREEGRALDKMAVLYRSHYHALELQMELTRRSIPFAITSGIRFFEQAHIKDVAAYLKMVVNPRDETAFKRAVKLLPGVGGKSADRLWQTFAAAVSPGTALAAGLAKAAPAAPKKCEDDWKQFTETIAQLEDPKMRASPAGMIRLVLEAGYEDYMQEEFRNYQTREEDLEQLASFALQFASVEEFLTQLSLQTTVEAETSREDRREDEEVLLSTIHQAKGLEFDAVFIIMLCDGSFPAARSVENREGEEEERRLFYVAITRARDELYLTYPLIRSGRGTWLAQDQQPSRFLQELPEELMDRWRLQAPGFY